MGKYNIVKPDLDHIFAVQHVCNEHGGKDTALPALAQSAIYGDFLVHQGDSMELRADSADAGTAYTRDELVQTIKEVLTTRRRKLKSKEILTVDKELQPGMLSYKVYKADETGRPTLLTQGATANDIGQVEQSLEYELYEIEYYAIYVKETWLDKLRQGNATPTVINKRARKMAGARRAMEEYADARAFKKQGGQQANSLLDNTWIPRVYLSTKAEYGMSGKALYNAVMVIVNAPVNLKTVENSEAPSVLLMPGRMIGLCKQTMFEDNAKYTVYQAILDNSSIESIVECNALLEASPAGHDVICAINPADWQFKECLPPTPLPPEITALADQTLIIGGDGGVCCTFAGSSCYGSMEFEELYSL